MPSPLYLFECDDAFLVKLDARRQLVFATRYGGSYTDRASAVAVDRGGGIYVAGATSSFDFPVVRAPQATSRSCGGQPVIACGTPFVMRFDRTGSTVDFATRLGGTRSTTIKGLAVDPAGNAYLVGVNSGNDFPIRRALQPDNGAGPMLVSDDGARTWVVGSGLRANIVYQIAWSTATPPLAYAGSDRGLFVSSDFGHSWTQAIGVPSGSVYAVAVDPATPAIVYAAVAVDTYNPAPPDSPYGLLKSLDGGRSWTMINNGISDADRRFIGSVAIAHSQPWTLYLVAGSHIYTSDDGGSSWRGSTNSAGAVAANPANPSIVYATASAAAFTVSTDGGRSWRRTWSRTEHSGQRAGKILVNPARPMEVIIPTEFGVVRSRDSGETWESISLGDIEGAFPAAINPTTPGDIWIGRRSLDRIADGSSRVTLVDGRFHFIDYLSAQRGRVLLSQGWAVNGFAAAINAAEICCGRPTSAATHTAIPRWASRRTLPPCTSWEPPTRRSGRWRKRMGAHSAATATSISRGFSSLGSGSTAHMAERYHLRAS